MFVDRHLPAFAFIVGLLCAHPLLGDVIHVKDGSQVVGTIEAFSGGKVKISTTFAGAIEIDLAVVSSIETDERLTVAMESGDRLIGPVGRTGEGAAVVQTAQGPVPISFDRVTAVWKVGQPSPEEEALVAKYKPNWSATIEAGFRMQEGNRQTRDARGRFDLLRTTSEDRLLFYIAADYADQNEIRNTNEYRGGVHYENNVSDRRYWYTRLDLEFDEFEDLDLRTTVAAGGGHFWIKKPNHMLKTRAGVGYRHESYMTGVTFDDVTLDLGLDYMVDLSSFCRLTHAASYSPSIEEVNNYRLNFDTALVFPLGDSKSWKLKLGVLNSYNSMPQPGIVKLDNTYYANVMLAIK